MSVNCSSKGELSPIEEVEERSKNTISEPLAKVDQLEIINEI